MALAPPRSSTLEELRFSNSFAALGDAFSERRTPSGVPGSRLVAVSPDAAALLGLRAGETARPEFTALVAGTALVDGMEPVAALYGGHQFGVWAGQLGDGRAILLGEAQTERGPVELQIKGAGMTAFSRMGDGRAVVRSTVREFLCSEAMDALGIPTTRALAMAAGEEPVLRESVERAATVIRLAPSFVRFGSFEIFHYRRQSAEVKTLADYVIERFYPEAGSGEDRYARFLAAVVERTAGLMAAWQSVGFAHGVMNTDNFSILGLTLDYGPFGFLEAYEPGFICNHTDGSGRYAFDRQPTIGLWNCYALAEALSSLLPADALEAALARYEPAYRAAFLALHRAKLGVFGARRWRRRPAARAVPPARGPAGGLDPLLARPLARRGRRAGAAGRGRVLAGLARALPRAHRRRPARRRAPARRHAGRQPQVRAPQLGRPAGDRGLRGGRRRRRAGPAGGAARALRRAPRARRVGPARSGEVC